jgi:hypothetical protein
MCDNMLGQIQTQTWMGEANDTEKPLSFEDAAATLLPEQNSMLDQ